ncbi:MAG: PstS family phosphate ABC transporter substrate-binding protein [Phycisphaerae bacterium]|nr:PstS family phosphate ABC transporter substrate-binding protein [Phycisphaerae bacterium]
MATRIGLTAVLALSLVVVGCGDEQEDQLSGEIKIAGSSTVYPISMAMAEEFSKLHPDVKVSVSSTGTGGGFKNFFIPGKSDINDASRGIKDSELAKCRENGIEPIELKVGIDALSMVCNKNADWVDDGMTFEQLKRIWGPDNPPQKWNQVDPAWPDAAFELYGPAATSGTFDYFTEVVIGEEDAHRSDYQKTEHDNVIVQGIQGNPHALGYFGFAYYVKNKDRLNAVAIAKEPGDDPVKPSLEHAQSGAYPLSRPLYIYVSSKALEKPHVKAFVEFYIRKAATELVSDVGYVPITDEQMKKNLAAIGVE